MRIYPAIDIKDGKCVRLFKGQFSDVTVYGDSPAEMAKKWESLGGEYIHVVDLDGALKGHGVNAAKIKEICESVNVPVQTGGGIRTMEDIEAKLACGIDRVIIGTKAVSDSEFVKRAVDKYGKKIVIGIDAKDGMVAIEGWEKTSDFTAVEFAKKMQEYDVHIGVLTVPIEIAQCITDVMVAGGIKAVWNFTPFRIRVPENIVVQNTSLYAHLAVMFNRLNFNEIK